MIEDQSKKTTPAALSAIELAIVIPAWRARFLGAALDSLRLQTDQRFRVYVGDDGSHDDLRGLIQVHGQGLDVVYHRFEENLGGTDLVAHWHRCIALTQHEPWIWLFSDDDVAEHDCVAAFHQASQAGLRDVELVKFNLTIIDENGHFIRAPEPSPANESAEALLKAILQGGHREWRAPEHIFSRLAYDRYGGFLNLPLALYSDLATWVKFAGSGGVLTLTNTSIGWRSHQQGTSSGFRIENGGKLLQALLGFLQWLESYLKSHSIAPIEKLCVGFIVNELRRMQPPVPWRMVAQFTERAKALAPHQRCVRLQVIFAIGFSHIRKFPLIAPLLHWRYRRKIASRT